MNRRLLNSVVFFVCTLAVWRAFFYVPSLSPNEFARQIRLATARDPEDGWRVARQATKAYPDEPDILVLAAEAAARAGQLTDMVQIVTRHEDRLLAAETLPGTSTIEHLIDGGYHRSAQALLDRRLQLSEDDTFALRQRSALLLSHGRQFLATQDLKRLLAIGAVNLDELVFLSSRREFLEDRVGLTKATALNPGFVPVIVGLGRLAAFEGNLPEAKARLQLAVSGVAVPAEAWAALGLIYYRQGLISGELQTWRQAVRSQNVEHPDIYFVKGWMASQEGAYRDSVDDLCRALQLAPLHRSACQLISELLSQHGTAAMEAELFSERAAAIHDLEQLAHSVLFGDRGPATMEKLAQLCEQLGETRLSQAWWKAADIYGPKSEKSAGALPGTQQRKPSRQSIAAADQLNVLLSRGIADQFQMVNRIIPSSPQIGISSVSETACELRFDDVAATVGMTENYFSGFHDSESGIWIYQGFGGGVAVIDFDGDDAPDFCFTQAGSWPSGNELPWHHQDLLYRNRVGVFDQVNRLAFSSEHGFGQGVAVGDADRDGFPDLYVANIGPNRLLMNNGDGTFRSVDLPVTSESQPGWTTSCLLTDLNADGLDDLYDVQYVEGNEPFERICRSGPKDVIRGCLPSLFNPA
ncbi:MAG: FG-GAP-like repeat-containing protein, partial [Planctomycetaceae bacterium]